MSGPLVLGIDPGNDESAYTLVEVDTCQPIEIGKIPNADLNTWLAANANRPARIGIEMIASYGMAVGREVFETCVWIGRFQQTIAHHAPFAPTALVYRRDVKLHHCESAKAKDPNITQALLDRFTPGAPNYGKGTKSEPGWFYGFHKDIWQAHALTVLLADQEAGR